jgi:glutathione S-transferase
VNEDFEQLRRLYARTAEHQFLALGVIAAADAFLDALFANRHADITAAKVDYDAKRAEFERVMRERPIG